MLYIFKTQATMCNYNNKKWWIDSNIVPEKRINANNLKEALEEYKENIENNHYISISENALKTKQAMYIDSNEGPIQTGYVIKASMDFSTDIKYVKQYIELWVEILEANIPNF